MLIPILSLPCHIMLNFFGSYFSQAYAWDFFNNKSIYFLFLAISFQDNLLINYWQHKFSSQFSFEVSLVTISAVDESTCFTKNLFVHIFHVSIGQSHPFMPLQTAPIAHFGYFCHFFHVWPFLALFRPRLVIFGGQPCVAWGFAWVASFDTSFPCKSSRWCSRLPV